MKEKKSYGHALGIFSFSLIAAVARQASFALEAEV
jgi:hypothetical protein